MSGPMINDGMHVQKYVYDFDVDGGLVSEIVLSDKENLDSVPPGSIVLDVYLHVETAVTSGGSLTMDVGNGDDLNGYMESLAVANLTLNAVHRAGSVPGALIWDDVNDHKLGLHVPDSAAGECSISLVTAAATAGKCGVYLEYIRGLGA